MPNELLIAVIAGAVALGSASLGAFIQSRVAARNRELELLKLRSTAEQKTSSYREPLLHAASDLQSRIFNILSRDFIERFLTFGNERERTYATFNTAFLIAQFFAWTEAVRLEIQYINLGDDKKSAALADMQGKIYSMFQTDTMSPLFRVFAGEQRAIGERMLIEQPSGLRCIGYGAFLSKGGMKDDPLFAALLTDTGELVTHLEEARPRLEQLQHALIDLLDFLDPQHLRVHASSRTKLAKYASQ